MEPDPASRSGASIPPDEFFLGHPLVRRSFDAASDTFDRFSAVHGEIRTRLLERLDVVRLQPAVVVDLGCATGHGSRALTQRYSSSRIVAIDLSPRMLLQAARQQRLWRRFLRVASDCQQLALRDGSVDLIFSNLMLQWCNDPDRAFAEMRRVLRAGGLLSFTTLGPGSLRELRAAWARTDNYPHVHRFLDMHDLGDALLRAGFAEPVMDTERLTITYPNFEMLRRELRASGSGNCSSGRRRGLAGRAVARELAALRESKPDQPLAVSLEVVYGHAWIGKEPVRTTKHREHIEVRIPISSVRSKIT